MQWMDIVAGLSAARHCCMPVVTAAVDELVFKRPIHLGDAVILKATVNYTGRTSMEVGVKVEREIARTRRREHCLSGYFTFVALGDDGKPTQVEPIVPVTDDEKRRHADADSRRQHRLSQRS
jgi:acyl-CoA hydrolase